jgi:transposase
LSIDEKAVKKGHEYISILFDEQTGIVLKVIIGHSDESIEELCLTALTDKQRECVETICSDMWQPYIKGEGAKTYFPNALHCHDSFHIVGYQNKAVDRCRRQEVKQHEVLKQTKYLFLKDKMSFTDEQYLKFEAVKNTNYEVSRAWQIKENFRDILFYQTPERARRLYRLNRALLF